MMKRGVRHIIFNLYWISLSLFFPGSGSAQIMEYTPLFQDNEILEARLEYSFRDIKRNKSDTAYYATHLYYQNKEKQWDSIKIRIRARGNFRREKCFFTPIKIKIKKKDNAGTLFEGNQNLKMVMPCLTGRDNNDLVVKEYLCYKLYQSISPYAFSTKLINLTLTDVRNKKSNEYQVKAFIIEDDKRVAKRADAKLLKGFQRNPLFMQDSLAAMQDVFQYMIGNTDWSSIMQHNVKVMLLPSKVKVPIPFDYDMAGLVDAPYAVVKESMPIKNVRERHFRGFCRNDDLAEYVRLKYLELEPDLWNVVRSVEGQMDPKQALVVENYLKDFFSVVRNKNRFDENISKKCRKIE
jgi:hypothetical protein